MKRSPFFALAWLLLTAGSLAAQGTKPFLSIGLPVADGQGSWVVLFSEPAKDIPRMAHSPGKQDVEIVRIADVRAFREDGLAASDTKAQPLQLTVWIPAGLKGTQEQRGSKHLYVYSEDHKGWIRLDNNNRTGFRSSDERKGTWDEGWYLQVTVYEWPAGDPPIGIGDGFDG